MVRTLSAAARTAHRAQYANALASALRTAMNAAGGVECTLGSIVEAPEAFQLMIAYQIGGPIGPFATDVTEATTRFLAQPYHREYTLEVTNLTRAQTCTVLVNPPADVAIATARVLFGVAPGAP